MLSNRNRDKRKTISSRHDASEENCSRLFKLRSPSASPYSVSSRSALIGKTVCLRGLRPLSSLSVVFPLGMIEETKENREKGGKRPTRRTVSYNLKELVKEVVASLPKENA